MAERLSTEDTASPPEDAESVLPTTTIPRKAHRALHEFLIVCTYC